MSEKFNEFENYYIVDSMPLEVTKLSRSYRSSICKETFYTSPDRGYCASQKCIIMVINYILFVLWMEL